MEESTLISTQELSFIKSSCDFHGIGQDSSSTKRMTVTYKNKTKQYIFFFRDSLQLNIQRIRHLFQINLKQTQAEIELIYKDSQNKQQVLDQNKFESQINKFQIRQLEVKCKVKQIQKYVYQASTGTDSSGSQKGKNEQIAIYIFTQDLINFPTEIVRKSLKISQFIRQLEQKYGICGIRLFYKEQDKDIFSQVSRVITFQKIGSKNVLYASFKMSYGIQAPCIYKNTQLYFRNQKKNQVAYSKRLCQQAQKGQFIQPFPFANQQFMSNGKGIEVQQVIHPGKKSLNQKKQVQTILQENKISQNQKFQSIQQLKVFQIMEIYYQNSKTPIKCHPKAQLICKRSSQNPQHCLKVYGNVFNEQQNLKVGEQLVKYNKGKFTYHQITKIKIINMRSEYNKHFMSLKLKDQKPFIINDGFGIKLNLKLIYFTNLQNKLKTQLQNCQQNTVKQVKQRLIKKFLKQGIKLKKFQLFYKEKKLKDQNTLADCFVALGSRVIIKLPQVEQICFWFSGQSRIYFQDQPYENTLQQMFVKKSSFKIKGYDHKYQCFDDFQIKEISKKRFQKYIIIQLQNTENQQIKRIICHPNVHFRCSNNKIKSYGCQDQSKLKQNDLIKIYKDLNQELKITKIKLKNQPIDLFKVTVFNTDRNKKAQISINQAQVINQDFYFQNTNSLNLYVLEQQSLQITVLWKDKSSKASQFKFDYYQNQNLTFSECLFNLIGNLPQNFILYYGKQTLKNDDKVEKIKDKFFGKDKKYHPITITMIQNMVLFNQPSNQIISNQQIQKIKNSIQFKSSLQIQMVSDLHKKALKLKNYGQVSQNKVFIVFQQLKFSEFYTIKSTFFWNYFQFGSTRKLTQQILKQITSPNCTVFQIQTYTAKQLNQTKDLVLLLPYVLFLLKFIRNKFV